MKNNRGFTLVEMLGVLIILIMIFMIMFPSLTKMIKDTNEEINAATVSIIEDATAAYLSEKSDVYPKGDDYTYCITLSELIDNADLTENQISSLDDPDMIVKTTFVDNKPVYVLTKTCIDITADIDFALIGQTNMSFEVGNGGQYVEPGVTALNKAGETVSYTTTITNSNKETVTYVDTTKVDIYTVKYSATIDGEDYSIERIVKVVDNTAPTITVNPTSETIAITNNSYNVLAGVTASDNSGDIPTIKASTNLSLGQAGTYTVNYTATDSSGNKKTAKRTVIISNSSLVNITLLGDKVVNHYANSGAYTDAGATAIDNVGTDLTSSLVKIITYNGGVVSTVEVDEVATYYVTYKIIKDGVTYSETRKVNIVGNGLYANGTPIYFNPVSGLLCTSGEAVSTTGTKTGCMKWFIFNDRDANIKVNLLLDHNTTALVAWNSTGSNIGGPTNVFTQLQLDTNSWAGVPTRSDNYVLNNGISNYIINYSGYKARFITAAEIADITDNASFDEVAAVSSNGFYFDSNNLTPVALTPGASNYVWLYDYTHTCTSFGCNIADSSNYGYWTSTAVYGDSSSAWYAGRDGYLYGSSITSNVAYVDRLGVRPVITISKSVLN